MVNLYTKYKGYRGMNPISIACKCMDVEKAKELIQLPSSEVNKRDGDSHNGTPIFWACENGLRSVMKLLLEKGADYKLKDAGGWTLLTISANRGHLDVVQDLVALPIDVNDTNSCKWSPMMWAASNGNVAIVRCLLDAGATVYEPRDHRHFDCLLLACQNGHLGVLKEITKKYPEWFKRDIRSDASWTPLMCAVKNNHIEVVKYLIEHGVNAELRTHYGISAMHIAVSRETAQMSLDLLRALWPACDCNAIDDTGKSVLMWACSSGNLSSARELLERMGADVNATSDNGMSVLEHAYRVDIRIYLINTYSDALADSIERVVSDIRCLSVIYETG